VHEHLVHGQLVRVLPGYTSSPLKVYVLMPARKLMPPSVRAFLTVLEETLGVPETRRPAPRAKALGGTDGSDSADIADTPDGDGGAVVIGLD
jgi:hypothetical protein